jgi:hypothetical protein
MPVAPAGILARRRYDWLRADLVAPKKQRHTVKRIDARLRQETRRHVPDTTLRDYVAWRRPQIAAEAGAPTEGSFVRHNRPGAHAEAHFGDVWVNLVGTVTKCYLFAFRTAYSGEAVHRPVDRTIGVSSAFAIG